MRRYWVPQEQIQHDLVTLKGDEYHHIIDVCRQETGSKFEVLGDGRKAHLVELVEIAKKSATAKILETREVKPLPEPHIVLAISIPRYQVMDAVVEKAVEMGVHEIRPFFSEFSFVRKKNSLPAGKLERWEKIVKSATQQCGRGELMRIHDPVDWQEIQAVFNQSPSALGLFAYEGKSAWDIRSYLVAQKSEKKTSAKTTPYKQLWLFVGSEGGFSPTEVEEMQKIGLAAVTLGEQVLRVETACITSIAVLKYEFDLMCK